MSEDRGDIGAEGVALVQEDPSTVGDGDVEALADAAVPVRDRGFLYGDAVFETLRCDDAEPAFVERHGERLAAGLDRLGVPFAPPDGAGDWLAGLADRLVAALDDRGLLDEGAEHDGGHRDAYCRVAITRGTQDGLLAPTETAPRVVAVGRPLATGDYAPADVVTTEVPRPNVAGDVKSQNYLASILARRRARDGDGEGEAPDEALMRAPDGDGYVSGAASNIVARVDGDWIAPPSGAATGVRPGVTRAVALELLAERDVAVDERRLRDPEGVEAAFLANSTWGVRRVARLDGRELAAPALVEELRRAHRDRATRG